MYQKLTPKLKTICCNRIFYGNVHVQLHIANIITNQDLIDRIIFDDLKSTFISQLMRSRTEQTKDLTYKCENKTFTAMGKKLSKS